MNTTTVPASGASAHEKKIVRLMELGFDRTHVTQALSIYNGDEERAASFLFSAGMGF